MNPRAAHTDDDREKICGSAGGYRMYAEKEGPKGETDFAALDIIFAEGFSFAERCVIITVTY